MAIVFKDLQKLVLHSQQKQQSRLFERLRDKPFWIWRIEEHKLEDIRTNGDCCFNHIIGLPTKERIEKPLFDYEKLLYDSLLLNEYSNGLNHTFNDSAGKNNSSLELAALTKSSFSLHSDNILLKRSLFSSLKAYSNQWILFSPNILL